MYAAHLGTIVFIYNMATWEHSPLYYQNNFKKVKYFHTKIFCVSAIKGITYGLLCPIAYPIIIYDVIKDRDGLDKHLIPFSSMDKKL